MPDADMNIGLYVRDSYGDVARSLAARCGFEHGFDLRPMPRGGENDVRQLQTEVCWRDTFGGEGHISLKGSPAMKPEMLDRQGRESIILTEWRSGYPAVPGGLFPKRP